MLEEEREGFEGVYPDDEEGDELDELGMHEEDAESEEAPGLVDDEAEGII